MQYKKLATPFIIPEYDTHFETLDEILIGYQHIALKYALIICKKNRLALDIGAHSH